MQIIIAAIKISLLKHFITLAGIFQTDFSLSFSRGKCSFFFWRNTHIYSHKIQEQFNMSESVNLKLHEYL